MITSVRFPQPVAVIKGESRAEWRPGERGVLTIASYPHGTVAFVFDECIREVVSPPGTVIETDEAAREAPNGPTSSAPSEEYPPARAIPKGKRVQR